LVWLAILSWAALFSSPTLAGIFPSAAATACCLPVRACHVHEVHEVLEAAMSTDPLLDHELIGAAPALAEVYDEINVAAWAEATVLISGESGTGKELAARAVHRCSARASGPFIAVNCAAIMESLAESELFGHEKGAFTDARDRRQGPFELADHGSIFLDEVGDLSLPMQARLLRVLDTRQLQRVGGQQPVPVDIRVIAATNKDLRRLGRDRFRADLFYRLAGFEIHLPPLRQRAGDVPLLVAYYLPRVCAELGLNVSSVSAAAMRLLAAYPWPGNIRELQSALRAAVGKSKNGVVLPEALPTALQEPLAPDNTRDRGIDYAESLFDSLPQPSLKNLRRQADRLFIAVALRRAGGNREQAARILDVCRTSVFKMIREHRLDLPPGNDTVQ
jgi:two-component system nitrogen regulation response regulator GlnG